MGPLTSKQIDAREKDEDLGDCAHHQGRVWEREKALESCLFFLSYMGFLGNVFFFSDNFSFASACLLVIVSGLKSKHRVFLPVEFKTPCQIGTVPS